MRIRIAIVEAVLWVLAVLGLGTGIVAFVFFVMAERAADGAPQNGTQAVGSFVGALYVASPGLILGTLALVGAGVMGAIERHRLTAVELSNIDRMQRTIGSPNG